MRPIDADALIKKWEKVHSKDTSFAMAVIGAINDAKKAPTIDAVPVVRCRDCIFHKEKRCTVWRERAVIVECYTDDDGYCYKGVRKEE